MKSAAAWIIILVWTALYVRLLLDSSFHVPAEITPVMLLAAGYFLGRDVKEKVGARVRKALEEDKSDE